MIYICIISSADLFSDQMSPRQPQKKKKRKKREKADLEQQEITVLFYSLQPAESPNDASR